jgi:hypothetical protein
MKFGFGLGIFLAAAIATELLPHSGDGFEFSAGSVLEG